MMSGKYIRPVHQPLPRNIRTYISICIEKNMLRGKPYHESIIRCLEQAEKAIIHE